MKTLLTSLFVALLASLSAAQTASAPLTCRELAARLDLLSQASYAGQSMSHTVAGILDKKVVSLGGVSSAYVRVDRREALDLFGTLSTGLGGGVEALSAASGLAGDMAPQFEENFLCPEASASAAKFKLVGDSFEASRRIFSTVKGILEDDYRRAAYSSSSELVIDRAETLRTFASLSAALKNGESLLESQADLIRTVRSSLVTAAQARAAAAQAAAFGNK